MDEATIFALASGAGRAGIAVIRVSGPRAGAGLAALTKPGLAGKAVRQSLDLGAGPMAGRKLRQKLSENEELPTDGSVVLAPRRATLCRLVSPVTGDVLDDALVCWFPGPGSFTGEDVVELGVHGGPAVIEGVLSALGSLEGFRLAEPGEFTKRAFHNGRLDLTQAEAVADLIDAETEAQKRQALRQADGELGRLYDGWRADLISVLAHLEATIDFSDEDLPEDLDRAARDRLLGLSDEVSRHLMDDGRGERLRQGVQIALLGPPNAGKSTLLNMLAGREAVIVSATAGTTRDVVEVHIDLGGCPATVADTAGLRASEDEIEREGVRRASLQAGTADLKVIILDRATWPAVPEMVLPLIDERALVALNKSDLGTPVEELGIQGAKMMPLSAKTGEGIEAFVAELARRVARLVGEGAGPALTRARHRLALESAQECLQEAMGLWGVADAEIVAEHVRLAAREIGRITGRVDVEDLLDVIFSDFCIGK